MRWIIHLRHPKTTQWVDLIYNTPTGGRQFTFVEAVLASLPGTLRLTSSDLVTRAVGLTDYTRNYS